MAKNVAKNGQEVGRKWAVAKKWAERSETWEEPEKVDVTIVAGVTHILVSGQKPKKVAKNWPEKCQHNRRSEGMWPKTHFYCPASGQTFSQVRVPFAHLFIYYTLSINNNNIYIGFYAVISLSNKLHFLVGFWPFFTLVNFSHISNIQI